MSDQDLLRSTAAGQVAAFEELYDRYRALAFGVARRVIWDTALAEDIVQEAFIGVWRNAGRYAQDRGTVRTWLLAIVHNRAIDVIRRRRLTVALPDQNEPSPSPLIVTDVWGEVAGRLDIDRIRVGLGSLSAVKREALELAYFGGLTQLEISERTRTPIGTIKSRIRLGLIELRRALEESPPPPAADPTPAFKPPIRIWRSPARAIGSTAS